ncbi:MAG TPA: hypothetical protein VE987_20500 [Polyangiaceae bacterium]|nr:hypothetical protein [Polyangiaceae bacterium]
MGVRSKLRLAALVAALAAGWALLAACSAGGGGCLNPQPLPPFCSLNPEPKPPGGSSSSDNGGGSSGGAGLVEPDGGTVSVDATAPDAGAGTGRDTDGGQTASPDAAADVVSAGDAAGDAVDDAADRSDAAPADAGTTTTSDAASPDGEPPALWRPRDR